MAGAGMAVVVIIAHPKFPFRDGHQGGQLPPIAQDAEGLSGLSPIQRRQPAISDDGLQPKPDALPFGLVTLGGVLRLGQSRFPQGLPGQQPVRSASRPYR